MSVITEVVLPGVDQVTYDRVRDTVGHLHHPPAGLQAHLTWWEGDVCHNVDAWESEDAFESFADDHLQPTLATLGITVQPQIRMTRAHEVHLPRAMTVAPTAPSATQTDDAGLIRSGYEAFGRGDIPAVLALFDPAIVWYSPDTVQFGGTYNGPDAVAGFFGRLPENYEELAVNPDRILSSGDTVIVLGHHTGRARGGNAFDVPFVHVWTMQGSKAVRFTEFFDTTRMNQALGTAEQRIDLTKGDRVTS